MQTDSEENEQEGGPTNGGPRTVRLDYLLAVVIVLVVILFIGRSWFQSSDTSPSAAQSAAPSDANLANFRQQTSLGLQAYQSNDFPKSEAAFRKALEYAPENAVAYNNLGSALNAQGKFDEAIPLLQKAVSLDANFGLAKNNLAFAITTKAKQQQQQKK
jgi:tetratricopeptide (TPR) repeat protein